MLAQQVLPDNIPALTLTLASTQVTCVTDHVWSYTFEGRRQTKHCTNYAYVQAGFFFKKVTMQKIYRPSLFTDRGL